MCHDVSLTCSQEVKQVEFFIGTVKLTGRTDWFALDSAVCLAFKVSSCVLCFKAVIMKHETSYTRVLCL